MAEDVIPVSAGIYSEHKLMERLQAIPKPELVDYEDRYSPITQPSSTKPSTPPNSPARPRNARSAASSTAAKRTKPCCATSAESGAATTACVLASGTTLAPRTATPSDTASASSAMISF